MDQIKMGKFIQELRKENNLTQKDIGDKLGITDNSVSKWERGLNAPDIYSLVPLAEIFHVTVKELLNGERNYSKKENFSYQDKSKILEIAHLTTKIGNKTILNKINMEVYEGEIVGLIGPNGAGKSTLIKTILSLYKKSSGTIKIDGYDTTKDFEKALSCVGSVIENPDLYKNISGMKNLRITSLICGMKDKAYIQELISLVKLENRINDKVKKYSLGMKQRLGLINALLSKPKLLILDEPTNGLDPLGIKELRSILKTISKRNKMAILISSHILSEIENICDRIIIIDGGVIIESIRMEDIKNEEKSLEEEFLEKTSGSKNSIR